MLVANDKPKVYPVTLFLTPKRPPLKLSQLRDVHCALEIVPALMRKGFEYGDRILDHPPKKPPPDPVKAEDLYPVDLSFLSRHAYLLYTTRPPLHDRDAGELGPRKFMRRSYTQLEDRTFRVWERYFSWLDRADMRLHPRLHELLVPPYENRRHLTFREGQGAPYYELSDGNNPRSERTIERTERRTAAFLLREEEAWSGGPGLIAAFGMDSVATAVWCYRLGRDLNHLLDRPGFVMAELTHPGSFQERPTDMRCSMDWKVEILFHHVDG